jgi:hypothetical protein
VRVRLSSNESPFGASPLAIEATTDALADAHLYPDDRSVARRAALAEHLARPADEIDEGGHATLDGAGYRCDVDALLAAMTDVTGAPAWPVRYEFDAATRRCSSTSQAEHRSERP